ncbi:MAG: aldehyde dehydrogenase family protein [Anaerolineales bacterium]|nr:aldehyde dehydrogenase family protein [Anaerolineales bacterium]
MDAALRALQQQKETWAGQSIPSKVRYIDALIRDFASVSTEWVEQVTAAQQIAGDDHAIGTEWMQGPYTTLRNLRCLRQSLLEIQSAGHPRIPGRVSRRSNGQVSAQVFPQTFYDRVLFNGYRAEVWMDESVKLETLHQTQALAYRSSPQGKVSLVLGAGNLSGIPATDALDRLFVQNRVAALKMNPVNDYLGPVFERGFRCLIEAGYLQILYGGADEGAYLCQHPGVDEIFVTGSDKTFDSILFGTGEAGERRKREKQPLLEKPVTGELGNVTPAIIIPGMWSSEDLAYQAENLASWLISNAGSACNTPRVIILHAEWPQREAFLEALRRVYSQTPLRCAFYPGSQQRYQAFLDAHSNAELIGTPVAGELPWTLILDASSENREDICFTAESFCSVAAVTPISAADVPKYLERAVAFANQSLWGTLAAGIFVHPASMKDPQIKAAVERAIGDLRYGTIGVNCAAGLSWVMMTTPWGAYPGSDVSDIRSGNDFVHNTLMFSKPQKTVLYAKFRETPKPIAFPSRARVIRAIGPLLVDLMANPNLRKLPRILKTAIS